MNKLIILLGIFIISLLLVKNAAVVEKFKVDGVVFELMKFCDVWGAVSLLLRRHMREAGIPFLLLEREYLLSSVGQLRTRIQAFLETIGG